MRKIMRKRANKRDFKRKASRVSYVNMKRSLARGGERFPEL